MPVTAFDPGTSTAYVADRTLVILGTPAVSDAVAALAATDAPVDELLAAIGEGVADVGIVRIAADTATVLLRGAASARLGAAPAVAPDAIGSTLRSDHDLAEVRSIQLAIGAPETAVAPTHRTTGGVVPAARLRRRLAAVGASGDGHEGLDPFDAMFGRTVRRTVEGAAIRAEPDVAPRALAVLLFSTGERVLVDQPVLLGRNPTGPVVTERHRAVKLHGAGVSRRHAAIHLDHWRALIDDLGSANGTDVTLPGRAPQRLSPGCPVELVVGTSVELGGEISFVVEEVA